MQELKLSIKASKSWRKLIKRIGGISSLRKRLNENLRQIHYKSGRECGEALDPVFKRNLAYRLENVVLVEDSCSISRQCQAIESVISRTPSRIATTSTPSSSPVLSSKELNLSTNPDSSTSISPKSRSCSFSGSCSEVSSTLREVVTDGEVADHSVPRFPPTGPVVPIPEKTVSIAVEEAGIGILGKIDQLDILDDNLAAKELELLERQVVAQEAMLASNTKRITWEADTKRKDALVETKAKANSIIYYVEELDKAINKTRDWKNASDYTVKKAIINIDKWKEELTKIIEMKREFTILVEKNSFTDDVKKDRVEREVEDLKEDMDVAILSIEKEDNLRALYTLDTTPVRDPVKLPKFSGKEGEDFHMFKEEMERGFVQNRTPRANQLSKLRECLFGVPLMFVPRSTVATIDRGMAVLKKSYGDAYRLIKYRKNELLKVGKFPEVHEKNKGGYSQQILWFLKVENILKGVLYLGKRHPEYSDVAFSFEFISTVIMMFPQRLQFKLCKCPGRKGDLLKNIIVKIENLREQAQRLQLLLMHLLHT